MCKKLLIILSLFILLPGCAEIETRDEAEDSFHDWSEINLPTDYRKKLGMEFLLAASKEFDFIRDSEVVSYVNRVGKELVKAAGSDPDYYHFFVVRKNQINAFAVPGGYIFIYDGLLRSMENEDALAGVLAHEIAHVERDHIFRDADKSGLVDIATIAGIILAGMASDTPEAALAIGQASNLSFKLKLSREHEEDADFFAIKYLKHSRYAPAGLADSFKTLSKFERLNSSGTIPPYLSTHPGIGSRQLIVEALTRDLKKERTATSSAADWDRIITIVKAYSGDSLDVSEFEKNHAGERMPEHRTHYLKGLYALKRNDFKTALDEYGEAIRLNPEEPIYHADLAALYVSQHHMNPAKKEALESIRLSSKNASPYLILGTIAMSEGNHEEALDYLKKADDLSYYDPMIQYQMAAAYFALKREGHMRLAFGRYYRFNLDRHRAFEQFRMALQEIKDENLKDEIKKEVASLLRDGI